jgi:hypothetical protein
VGCWKKGAAMLRKVLGFCRRVCPDILVTFARKTTHAWLVYPGERSVQIFQLNENGRYIGLRPYISGDIVTTPVVPGMEVLLADVFDV